MDNHKRNKIYLRNKKKQLRKNRIIRNRIIFFTILILLISCIGYASYKFISNKNTPNKDIASTSSNDKNNEQITKEPVKKDILISFAGDCTLGTDTTFDQSTSLPAAVKANGNDYSYIFKNVKPIFGKDDYTLVNLETTFTNATEKFDKGSSVQFHFKGPKTYTNMLTEGSIEGVTVANNHIYDYGQKGFNDTIKALEEKKIDITGEGHIIRKTINGIKFGFLGYQAWDNSETTKSKIKKDIDDLKAEGTQVIIPYFHWGVERDNKPTEYQIDLAHFSIDNGATMVLGSHPHVIQSLENYKGKLIAYSLANFAFGGNSNPQDKRTFILQAKFNFNDNDLGSIDFKVLPATISSVSNRNDYVPTLAKGETGKSILKFINNLSPTLDGKISESYFELSK